MKTNEFTIKSEKASGAYEKTIKIKVYKGYGTSFVRFEAVCKEDIGAGSFNISANAASGIRDALTTLLGPTAKVGTLAPHGVQEYKGHGGHDWEDVGGTNTRRLRVPGGWLYRVGFTGTTTFVPMPDVVGYKI